METPKRPPAHSHTLFVEVNMDRLQARLSLGVGGLPVTPLMARQWLTDRGFDRLGPLWTVDAGADGDVPYLLSCEVRRAWQINPGGSGGPAN